jgi:hypothetical protein
MQTIQNDIKNLLCDLGADSKEMMLVALEDNVVLATIEEKLGATQDEIEDVYEELKR